MAGNSLLRAIGTFIIAAGLVIGLTAGTGLVMTTGNPSGPADVTPQSFQPDQIDAQPVDDSGSITMQNVSDNETIVIDTSHGNSISRASIQPFVDALTEAGHSVSFVSGGGTSSIGLGASSGPTPFEQSLTNADALVIANPAMSYTSDEIDSIQEFAEAGGRVLLLADTPTQGTDVTSILGLTTGTGTQGSGQPNDVAARYGMTFGSGYIYDMNRNANNFQLTYASVETATSVTEGVSSIVFDAAVPVVSDDDTMTLVAVDGGKLSSTRVAGSYPVIVRSGNVTAVGDTWFLSADGATVEDNEILVANLGTFLVSGDKEAGVPSFETGVTGPGGSFPTGPTTPSIPSNNSTNSTISG